MWWRSLILTSVVMIIAGACFLLWEARGSRTTPIAQASQANLIVMADNFAGGSPAVDQPNVPTHEEINGSDISEGKRLYAWFNCNTCHANGGGDIGPALMDDKWIYGEKSENIFASIVEGRPNGMPSYRGKIPDAQVWQLVAYVRSMSGHVPLYARPSRNDDIASKPPETMAPIEPVHKNGSVSPDNRATTNQ